MFKHSDDIIETRNDLFSMLEEIGLEVEVVIDGESENRAFFKMSNFKDLVFSVTEHYDYIRPHLSGLWFSVAKLGQSGLELNNEKFKIFKNVDNHTLIEDLHWPTGTWSEHFDGTCNDVDKRLRDQFFVGESKFFNVLKRMS